MMSIALTDDLQRLLRKKVENGQFPNEEAVVEEALRRQHAAPCFPVQWGQLRAQIEFIQLDTDRWYEFDGLRVKAKLQPHPGDSYGYRFEQANRSAVYSTDGEHQLQSASDTAAMVE